MYIGVHELAVTQFSSSREHSRISALSGSSFPLTYVDDRWRQAFRAESEMESEMKCLPAVTQLTEPASLKGRWDSAQSYTVHVARMLECLGEPKSDEVKLQIETLDVVDGHAEYKLVFSKGSAYWSDKLHLTVSTLSSSASLIKSTVELPIPSFVIALEHWTIACVVPLPYTESAEFIHEILRLGYGGTVVDPEHSLTQPSFGMPPIFKERYLFENRNFDTIFEPESVAVGNEAEMTSPGPFESAFVVGENHDLALRNDSGQCAYSSADGSTYTVDRLHQYVGFSPASTFVSPAAFLPDDSPASFWTAKSVHNSPAYVLFTGLSPITMFETITGEHSQLSGPLAKLQHDYRTSLNQQNLMQPLDKELN